MSWDVLQSFTHITTNFKETTHFCVNCPDAVISRLVRSLSIDCLLDGGVFFLGAIIAAEILKQYQ